MDKTKSVALSGSVGAVVGFGSGKFSGGDLKALASQTLDGFFKFLHEQGAYASFAIVLTLGFGFLAVWCIRTLVDGKQREIDRVVEERNKFEQLFIEDWQSTNRSEKALKRK